MTEIQSKILVSIVLYKTELSALRPLLSSLLETRHDVTIVLVDNSPTPNSLAASQFADKRLIYQVTGHNLGFGKGHNFAFERYGQKSDLWLILNPDIEVPQSGIDPMYDRLSSDPKIGALMPRVVSPDGSLQTLCRLLPTPLDLIIRRFVPLRGIRRRVNRRYELWEADYNTEMNVPLLSGCCLLVRSRLIEQIGGFDPNFFMYLEDFDLCRRISNVSRLLYTPIVQIGHEYGRQHLHSTRLLLHFIFSAFYYFSKWGWFFDMERQRVNREAIERLVKVRRIEKSS